MMKTTKTNSLLMRTLTVAAPIYTDGESCNDYVGDCCPHLMVYTKDDGVHGQMIGDCSLFQSEVLGRLHDGRFRRCQKCVRQEVTT